MATVDRQLSQGANVVKSGATLETRTRQFRTAVIYLIPAFAVMALMTFYPLLYQTWMSFTDYGERSINPNSPNYQAPQWIGLENYRKILANEVSAKLPNFNFLRMLLFNLWWTFSNVLFHVGLGIAVAIILNTEGLWFKRLYRAIYILPMVLPSIVIATVWRNMFDDKSGAVNLLLRWVFRDPDGFQIRWLTQIDPTFPGSWLPSPTTPC
jgi:arabinogalactan oligomer / maltooligosaccharide transport system permease protein